MPLVTGHKYRMYWDIGQMNWNAMKIEVGLPWLNADKPIFFNYPYTENYEAFDFFGKYDATFAADGTGPLYYDNQSLSNANLLSGMNSFDVAKKELTFVINGAVNSSKNI